jgi:segregation and condensation protein B
MSESAPSENLLIQAKLETILFVAEGSVSINQLCETLNLKPNEVEMAIAELKERLEKEHGFRILRHGGKIQFTTAPEFATLVEKFLGLEATARLTRASLETLAIIAYKQPITHPGIDAIRGVNSDGVLKSLLFKGLVEEIGRAVTPGRPILYGTTSDFLRNFGIGSLDELPDINSLDKDRQTDEQIKVLKD